MKNLILFPVFISLAACSIVGPGEKGVRVTWGSVSEDVKESGVYLWIPGVTDVRKISIQIQKSDVDAAAATKDMQDVHADIAVNWSMEPKDLINTYRTIGDEHAILDRIIQPAVNEILKASTAKRTAEEVLTKRMEMKSDIDNSLKTRLAQYGITLHDISIVDLKFSKDFTHAIEQKQIAEQQAKQAEYVALKATQDAKAEVEKAKGQSEAQRLYKSTLTREILQQRAIEKWDGHFPQILGSNVTPFIDLRGFDGPKEKQ